MKLNQLHEVRDEDSNPEFDAHVQQTIAANYTKVEQLSEGGAVPLDPHAYDTASATQANIQEWFNVLVVNDTENDDYAQALNVAQTPMAQYMMQYNDDFIGSDVVPQLKQLSDSLSDRFTITQLAQVNAKWVEMATANTTSYEDISNDPDLGSEFADSQDYQRDPSGFHGVRNSDFI